MRVLFVTNMFPTPARPTFGIFVQRMASALRSAGHVVEVVEVAGERGAADYLAARPRVAAAARTMNADVVHVHFGYSVLPTSNKWPRVVTFYGDDLNGESRGDGSTTLKSRIGKRVSWWAARACERSIAVSERLQAMIPDAAARARCTVIPDPVDVSLFSPLERHRARAALGLDDQQHLVIFPHDVRVPTKRFDLAHAAVECIRRERPDVHLWVVNGRAPEDMPMHYAAADLMLVTSDTEGGPSSVKEALACGIPVVSVDVGDTATLARVGRGAYIVGRDTDAIARGIGRALDERGPTRISLLPSELALPRAADQVVDVYSDAIQRHRARRVSAE